MDKYNLYLSEEGKEPAAVQLTKDGSEDYSFVVGQRFGIDRQRGEAPRGEAPRQRSAWSPDSKHFYTIRQDSRGVKELFVINSLASPRPTLEKYKYPMPGEEAIRKGELYIGSRERRRWPPAGRSGGTSRTATCTGARRPASCASSGRIGCSATSNCAPWT